MSVPSGIVFVYGPVVWSVRIGLLRIAHGNEVLGANVHLSDRDPSEIQCRLRLQFTDAVLNRGRSQAESPGTFATGFIENQEAHVSGWHIHPDHHDPGYADGHHETQTKQDAS